MTTRRTLFIAAPVLAVAPSITRLAPVQAAEGAEGHTDLLFVQTAKHLTFDRATGRMSLEGRAKWVAWRRAQTTARSSLVAFQRSS
jgi:hypothetical protein